MNPKQSCNIRWAAMLLMACGGLVLTAPATAQGQVNNPTAEVQSSMITASGTVIGSDGEPVIGATVLAKGHSGTGVSTDIDGKFTLKVPAGSTLVISYIGCVTQEVKASSTPIEIYLKEDAMNLDEVVVVGFGAQKKVNLTGSVSVADQKALKERPVMSAAQALQGVVPGLQINNSNGKLETNASIQIRGNGTIGDGSSGTPLILIDGMEGDINALNPQDIESISVLKDAAAASIYGSRAPFGVILVTTKKGSEGKATINYNNSFRFSNLVNRNHTMDSYRFALFMDDNCMNTPGWGPHFSTENIERILQYQNGTYDPDGDGIFDPLLTMSPQNGNWQDGPYHDRGWANTDWFDAIYKDHNFSQEHNLSVSGGTERINYYFSANYLDNDGMLAWGNEGLKRYTVTGKFNVDITKWMQLGFSHRWVRTDYVRPSKLTDDLYKKLGRQGWPVIPIYDPNGNIFDCPSPINGLANGGDDRSQTDRNYTQINLIFRPLKGWDIHAEFNYSVYSNLRHWDTQKLYGYDVEGNPFETSSDSHVHEEYKRENFFNINAYTNYDWQLNEKNNFHFMLGFQTENMKQTEFGLQRDGILIASMPEVDLTTGIGSDGKPATPSVNGGRNQWDNAGFFGRINYNYDSRYLLEANLRYDGTSRFRQNRRWIWLPSVSVGWNIANEKFWEDYAAVCNNLKLRASYGVLGNQNITNWYQTYRTLDIKPNNGAWLQDGTKPATVDVPALISQLLTWEKIYNYNFGLDWGLFNNRLTGSFEYFIRDTKNMVGPSAELPNILGTDVPKTNNCNLRTHGWDLEIAWNDRLPFGMTYGARFVLSDARTKITKYQGNLTNDVSKYIEGRYIDEIFGYETLGMAKSKEEYEAYLDQLDANYTAYHGHAPATPRQGMDVLGKDYGAGDIMYKDLNGDGIIDGGDGTIDNLGDRKLIGSRQPRYLFSLDLNAAYKGFDLRVFFQGVAKRDYFQGDPNSGDYEGRSYFWGSFTDMWNMQALAPHYDYFRDENTWSVQQGYADVNYDAYFPRPTCASNKNRQVQTRYLQNASYIRLKNLQVGYTIPAKITNKAGFSNVRVYFSGENLWTGTKLHKLFDPETIGNSQGGAAYPLSRTYSFGLSLTI